MLGSWVRAPAGSLDNNRIETSGFFVAMQRLLIIIVSCLLLYSVAKAQQPGEERAAYYFNHGEYAQAAQLYEGLYRQSDNAYYYRRILSTYMELGRYKDAIHLIEHRQKRHPLDLSLYVDAGSVYLQQNQEKKARKCFTKALESITSNLQPIPSLAQAFSDIGQFSLAAQTYLTARRKANNSTLYFSELIGIYQQAGDYKAMVDEYFSLLDSQPRMIQSVQVSMQQALAQSTDDRLSNGIRQALVARMRQHPENAHYLEMMIWYALQESDFTFALESAIATDARFPDIGGEQVLRVARIAEQNEAYDVASRAYVYLRRKGVDSPYYIDSWIGELEVDFKRIQSGIYSGGKSLQWLRDQYLDVIAQLGRSERTIPLMRHCATLMAYNMGEVQPAVDLLDDILEMPRLKPRIRDEVKLELGDLLLFVAQPWDASLLYMQVERANANDALGAMAKFKNAKLSYFNHDFAWATSQLRVLRSSTSKLVANDAMELSLLISDNMEDDSTYAMLSLFANADLLLYRNLLDSAWDAYDAIVHQVLAHPLFDEVLLRKAQVRIRQGRYAEADSLLARLVEVYPDDLTADDALMLRAELNENQLSNPLIARSCYEQLLLNYPESLFADRARKRYNQLKSK